MRDLFTRASPVQPRGGQPRGQGRASPCTTQGQATAHPPTVRDTRGSLWAAVDQGWDEEIATTLGRCPAVHNPQPLLQLVPELRATRSNRKRDGVKFRCERDLLVEGLATAGRAVSSRGSSLPVLAASGWN